MHPLLEAIGRGDIDETARLIRQHPSWLAGEHAFKPLHFAALKGHKEMVACLLDLGADPNVAGHFGHESAYNGLVRPIHAAAGEGHADVVELLINRGAETGAGNRYMTPMLTAAEAGHKAVVKVLVKAGAKADIFVASALGKLEPVKALLARDPSRAKRRTELGVTALMLAAAGGYVPVAEGLLEAKADPKAHDVRKNFVLDYAAGIGHFDPRHREDAGQAKVAEILIARGADVNSRNWRGVRPLHHAARTGRAGVARVLIAHGAEVDAKDVSGETALSRAVTNPAEIDLAKVLVEAGADVNMRDRRNRRILSLARGVAMKSLLKKNGAR
jgi:ankyrin repeat protein